MITSARLAALAMGPKNSFIPELALPLDLSLSISGESAPLRVAHFTAQICYESQFFTRLEENLRYTHAQAIIAAFEFLAPRAAELVFNPQALANAAYAGVNGNGDEASGDGWLFRGRGLIQLTGRANYAAAQAATGLPLIARPDLASDPGTAVELARCFWRMRECDASADLDDVRGVTEKINGLALRGLSERTELTTRAKTIFV